MRLRGTLEICDFGSCGLFQLFSKLQAVKAEIHDLQEEHIKERQELEQTQNELTRELKLKWVPSLHCLLVTVTEIVSMGGE